MGEVEYNVDFLYRELGASILREAKERELLLCFNDEICRLVSYTEKGLPDKEFRERVCKAYEKWAINYVRLENGEI